MDLAYLLIRNMRLHVKMYYNIIKIIKFIISYLLGTIYFFNQF